jgi:SAM-dependent methyltransferase
MLEEASRANPWAHYRHYDGRHLPFEDGSFDLSFAICVLHHVEPLDRGAFAVEMARILRPEALAVVFEHNPYNPLTRKAVNRCDFDRGVILLSRRQATKVLQTGGLDVVDAEYIIFSPWKHEVLRRAERGLRWLPLGAQYVVAATKRARAPGP